MNPEPATIRRHPVQLRGVYASKDDAQRARPSILQMREQDFIQRLLHDLTTPEGRGRLQADVAATRNAKGTLRLFQPVHRVSHDCMKISVCRKTLICMLIFMASTNSSVRNAMKS